MNYKLREYIDSLFIDAPHTVKVVEMKEEILQNLLDKYNDLRAEGRSEEAAYNIAIASIGDISELIQELQGLPAQEVETAEAYRKRRQKSALLTAIAICMYILCVVPLFLFRERVGLVLMFVLIASATGLLIYNGMTTKHPSPEEQTMAEEFQEWRQQSAEQNKALKSINSAVWVLAVAVYVIVSFSTYAFHITWVIFLLAAAVTNIIKAIYDLKK